MGVYAELRGPRAAWTTWVKGTSACSMAPRTTLFTRPRRPRKDGEPASPLSAQALRRRSGFMMLWSARAMTCWSQPAEVRHGAAQCGAEQLHSVRMHGAQEGLAPDRSVRKAAVFTK